MDAQSALTVDGAMRRALELAAERSVGGPNPRVGCVILAPGVSDDSREVLGEGRNHGAGTAHAEVEALANARARGADLQGATAVVTLEPCNHTGRTPPCSQSLLDAGIGDVVFAVGDPHDVAAGGGEYLESQGVTVTRGLLAGEAETVLGVWLASVRLGRPFVTLKTATTLDGRVAAADGTSRWITGEESRAHAHRVRSSVDAILIGTGTAIADDPTLSARTPNGDLYEHQPLRVVVGNRPLPASAALRRSAGGEVVHVRTRDVAEVVAALHVREVRHVVVEGGPGLASAFLAAGVVDEVHAYIAPMVLGAGRSALDGFGVGTIADASRFSTVDVCRLGDDVLVVARSAVESYGRKF